MPIKTTIFLGVALALFASCNCGAPSVRAGTCTDGQRNGPETSIDCGGGECGGCPIGGGCALDSDCAAGTCLVGICRQPSCADGIRNGAETAIDCGGAACPACADGSACAAASDCASAVCSGGTCQAATCADGVRNGAETAIDCGGSACPACADGSACAAASDCTSAVCSGGTCQSATCADGARNGGESDVDCGGGCPACPTGAGCGSAADCQSAVCSANVCATPSCSDGVENGAETSVDCGGGTCATCATGAGCVAGADCQSGVCQGGFCQASACNDAVRNGTETDVDCGGNCSPCGTNGQCSSAPDCASSVCAGGRCQAPSCADGVRNGSETGVDCGGGCAACPAGGGCGSAIDCQSGVCAANVCRAPTCSDGVANGTETDVDCGGACPNCATGRRCSSGPDCQSGVCTAGACAAPSCSDGVANGTETDVDCGGNCAKCGNGKSCLSQADCSSGVCQAGVCQAQACTDGVRNGAETAVDCGGPDCAPCGSGKACATSSDCQSGVCAANVCQAPSCSDGVANGSETDVDCGGSCAACPSNAGCGTAADCQSGVCTGNICQPASCADGVKNAAETGVDCGGGTCAACPAGGGCTSGGDCQSNVCTASVCQAPSCADGAKNGAETDVDCGGQSCAACPAGDGCGSGADCQSAVCVGGICRAPTCNDGVRNGSETAVDCGGSTCGACANGQSCSAAADCQSGVCQGGACSPCGAAVQCSAGLTCQNGACVTDVIAPTVRSALLLTPTSLRVIFSEPVSMATSGSGALNVANYCIELFDDDPSACSATSDFAITAAVQVGAQAVDLTLSLSAQAKTYTLVASNVVDLASIPLGTPKHADFTGAVSPFRVVLATPVDRTHVDVVFSKPLKAGPDSAGSAGCTTAAQCAQRYKLLGATSLGTIIAVTARPAPLDNEIILEHQQPQGGGMYTLIAANGINGDGFDDVSFGALLSQSGAETLGASPKDRASFTGAGDPIVGIGDGPVSADPFADSYTFTYVFKYREKIYLGPSGPGDGALRMNADGSQPENVGFAFAKDVNNAVGTKSGNNSAAPFPSIGAAGCANNTYACGPDNENGRGLFASGQIGGQEWLIIGGSQSGGGLDYIYMTRDGDTNANFKYVDLSPNVGGTTKAFSAMTVTGGRAYLGFPDTGGARKPVLLSLNRAPSATATGLDVAGNGTGTAACNPTTHDSCNLMAHRMPGIGVSGTPANSASVQMIDFFGEFNGKLYLGNNGGLIRSTTSTPLDYGNAPGDWAVMTPSSAAYTALISVTTSKTQAIEPADRAWPQIAALNGHVFLGRNTTSGPQLWRCDPAVVSGPAPATATDCDPGDWSLVAGNSVGNLQLTQFDNVNNARITLVVANGSSLYVGFDNAVDGIVLYRSQATIPGSRADFTGLGGCVATSTSCQGIGGNGFGSVANHTRIFDASSQSFGSKSYLYVAAGNGTVPVRVYRTQD